MADEPQNTSDVSDHTEPRSGGEGGRGDERGAAGAQADDHLGEAGRDAVQLSQDDKSASEDDGPRPKTRRITPPSGSDDALREQISSPKKKRARDELDENKDAAPPGETPDTAAANTTTTVQDRTDRSEPEKKRPRDRQASASAVQGGKEEVQPLSAGTSPRSSTEQTEGKDPAAGTSKPDQPKQTSAAAFASSGFAKLAASTTSPFGSFGASSGKPSLFGSSSSGTTTSPSPGGPQPAAPSSAPKLSFGAASAVSPFAGLHNGQAGAGSSVLRPSPFASAFGGGGGSALSGPRLSFGKPGEALKSDKPAKPFGAPDSDAEDGSGEESNEDEDAKGEASSDDEGKEDDKDKNKDREDGKGAADDKKKLKLQKVVVDDGEGSETTLFSVRAKMFVMEKGVGWKERGAGMLKVNVPKSTVEPDDSGAPDPSSFDPSALADEQDGKARHVRLIMRQDHTLRVILNTVVLPAMKFHVTNRLKASTVLFTAFEDGQARQVQMKMSEANAAAFSQLIEMLKKRLADV
ncbi:hypothetical protein VTH06DRAFT_1942 [Thermothelomyces fergusii]